MSNTYEYIVVGAGAAGSVVAARLASKFKVLLLESGEDTRVGNGNLDAFNKFTVSTGLFPVWFSAWAPYPSELATGKVQVAAHHLEHRSNVRQGDDSLYSTSVGFRKQDDIEPPRGVSEYDNFRGNSIVFPRFYHYPRAAGAGGSVQHHALVHGRGSSKIYDRIASIVGDSSWSGANIDRIWKKIENYSGNPNATANYHSTTGWLKVKRNNAVPPISRDIREACLELSIPETLDFNDPKGVSGYGVSESQMDRTTGTRNNSFTSLIDPLLNSGNPNLTVKFNSLASRILIDVSGSSLLTKGVEVISYPGMYANYTGKDKLYPIPAAEITPFNGGVEVVRTDTLKAEKTLTNYIRYYCSREVIISCSFVQTPQLLMLSGLGPQSDLQALGITCLKDLPGVGHYMQDHNEQFIAYEVDPKKFIPPWQAKMLLVATGLIAEDITGTLKHWTGFGTFFGRTLNYDLNHLTIPQRKALKDHYMSFINSYQEYSWADADPFADNGIPHMLDWHSGWDKIQPGQTYKDVSDTPYPGMFGGSYDIQDPNLHIHMFGASGLDFDCVNFTQPKNGYNYVNYYDASSQFYKTTADGSGSLVYTRELRNRDASANPIKPNQYSLLLPTTVWPDSDNRANYYSDIPAINSFLGLGTESYDPSFNLNAFNTKYPMDRSGFGFFGLGGSYVPYRFNSKDLIFFDTVSVDITGLPNRVAWGFLNENLRSQNLNWIDLVHGNNVKANTGSIKLRSNNPAEPPILDMALWKNSEAHQRMAGGTTIVRQLMNTRIMKQYARNKSVPTDILGNFVEFGTGNFSRDGVPLDLSGNDYVDASRNLYYRFIDVSQNVTRYQVVKAGVSALSVYNTRDASDCFTSVTYTTDIINSKGEYLQPNTVLPISDADTWEWETNPGRTYMHIDASGNFNNATTDTYIRDYIKKWTSYGHHGSGTCPMGPNQYLDSPNDWVVDSKLKVRGVTGLRIADTSVYTWPELHGYNTSTAAYVIGEMCAEFILKGQ